MSNQQRCEVSCRLDGSWTRTGFIAEEFSAAAFKDRGKKRMYASYWGPFQISSSLLITMWIYLREFVVYVSVHLWEDTSYFTSSSYTSKVQNNRGRPIIRADTQHFSDHQYPWFFSQFADKTHLKMCCCDSDGSSSHTTVSDWQHVTVNLNLQSK